MTHNHCSNLESFCIIFGRELLAKGVVKSIGNGSNTKVWLDKWVFDGIPGRPMNKETHMNMNLLVLDLINENSTWDLARLKELFLGIDVNRIMSYPPNKRMQDDWIWAHSKDGKYSVKSGNWLASQSVASYEPSTTATRRKNELKSRIWKIKTAPKIKMFLWRVMSGALAVGECLRAHRMQANLVCQICKIAPETIIHVLFECGIAKQVWSTAKINMSHQASANTIENYMEHLLMLVEKGSMPVNYRKAIPWLIWGIWKQRNGKVYAGNGTDVDILIAQALEESEEWWRLNDDEGVTVPRQRSEAIGSKKWCRPRIGMLKCNVNSSWVNSFHMCGGSWIVRDHRGEVIFHARDAFLPAQNRIAAELRCILWATQSLCELRVTEVETWSECGAAVQAIQNPRDWPRFRSFLDHFQKYKQCFRQLYVRLSSPQANVVARKIAMSVTKEGRLQSYLAKGGPAWLSSLIEEDRLT